jgi:two-component system, sensor histidine kinase
VEYTVKLVQESSMLQFSVSDTGIGVDESKQKEIFQPFKQLSGPTCNLGGTGLGLSIAKKLVETMGGELTLESSTDPDNHGSTFRFTIPYIPATTQASQSHSHSHSHSQITPDLAKKCTKETSLLKGRVLVCDDNKVNCKLAQRFVTRMGCEVECVEDGQLALEKYRMDPDGIDLILMDKEMPVLDGLEATRAIRSMEAARGDGKRVPIIAVTAAAAASDRKECMEAGCDGYCSKPLNKDKLRAMLGDFLPMQ